MIKLQIKCVNETLLTAGFHFLNVFSILSFSSVFGVYTSADSYSDHPRRDQVAEPSDIGEYAR